MKQIKPKTTILIIVAILVIATITIGFCFYVNNNSGENGCKRSPNGCPPPGMCDAPNDGYISCDRLNTGGSVKQ